MEYKHWKKLKGTTTLLCVIHNSATCTFMITVIVLQVIETAHHVGLATTATIMWGHCDGPRHWAQHLRLLRELQGRTYGITEFVPLPFVHMEAPIFLKGKRPSCVALHVPSCM